MPHFESNGGSFRVHSSKDVAVAFEKLYRRAKAKGQADAFIAAARDIAARLQRDADEFGEPLYNLPALNLEVRHAMVAPLLIYFAVHKDRPLVFIKRVALLPEEDL
jgi:hypothetical protein